MSSSHVPHRRRSPADIVGIPADELADRLAHVLAEDSGQAPIPASLFAIAEALGGPQAGGGGQSGGDDSGHEDMLPQLRVVDAMLGKGETARSPAAAPPFADIDAAERRRRLHRQALSRRDLPQASLPQPTPQAENDRLLLEEIGKAAPRTAGGWTAEPTPPEPTPPPSPEPVAVLPHPLTDEVMDGFIAPRATAAPPSVAAKPKRTLRVKSKRAETAAEPPPVPPAPEAPAPSPPPAVKLRIKGKPRRSRPAASPTPEIIAAPPEPPPPPEPAPRPAVKLRVKGKPRSRPTPPTPAEAAPPPAETPPENAVPAPPEIAPAQNPPPDPLLVRVEEIIALHRRRPGDAAPGDAVLPDNREALAALLDDAGPTSDFAALDLLYACWHKNTHDCGHRALLAVAQHLSRNFGLPNKLPMASSKAWKMLDGSVFSGEFADRLAEVGRFIADWQKTQRIFLILEFSEIELIEHLFEALSPADHPNLLAEVMNYKVLSNRRMGLLRRIPARLRRQVQPLLPDRKEEALVVLAHGKVLLQQIADPRGFAPIVEVANKMVEEMDKLMKQTANTGAPPQPGGAPGGGQPLGRIG